MKKTVRIGDRRIELSQPLRDQPGVILVVVDDGRRTILPEVGEPLTMDEYRMVTEHRMRAAG